MSDLGQVEVGATATVQDNGFAEVVLRVSIPSNTHIEAHEPAEPFLIPTVAETAGLSELDVEYPEPRLKDLGLPGAELLVYEGDIEIRLRGRLIEQGVLGGTVRYQPCVGGACLPPRIQQWQAEVP